MPAVVECLLNSVAINPLNRKMHEANVNNEKQVAILWLGRGSSIATLEFLFPCCRRDSKVSAMIHWVFLNPAPIA